MVEGVWGRAPRVSPAIIAMRRAKMAQDRYGRGSYNERHRDDDRPLRPQPGTWLWREMSGHDYGQGRRFEQDQYGRQSSIGVLTVSTSLVAAWDRCGVSASCDSTIGLNKHDGPPPLASTNIS